MEEKKNCAHTVLPTQWKKVLYACGCGKVCREGLGWEEGKEEYFQGL